MVHVGVVFMFSCRTSPHYQKLPGVRGRGGGRAGAGGWGGGGGDKMIEWSGFSLICLFDQWYTARVWVRERVYCAVLSMENREETRVLIIVVVCLLFSFFSADRSFRSGIGQVLFFCELVCMLFFYSSNNIQDQCLIVTDIYGVRCARRKKKKKKKKKKRGGGGAENKIKSYYLTLTL